MFVPPQKKSLPSFAVSPPPPPTVKPEQLEGLGEVQRVTVQSLGPAHRALVLFTEGSVSVWDLRAARLAAAVQPFEPGAAPALAAAGAATAMCWLGTSAGDFATGHEGGAVLVWSLEGLQGGATASHSQGGGGAPQPKVLCSLRWGRAEGGGAGCLARAVSE